MLAFDDLPVAANNCYLSRDGTKIDTIVLHTMVGTWQSANSRFNNASAQVSAHWGVCYDGTLKRWVEEQFTAYCNGDWGVNLRAVGIENEDMGLYDAPRPDALYNKVGALVAQIAKTYGISLDRAHLVPGWCGHRDVHATACPDALDLDRIIAIAKGAPTPIPDVGSLGQPVAGAPTMAVDRLEAFLLAKAPNSPPGQAKRVYDVATRFGLRPEVVLAQEIHETNYFNYGGTEVGFSADPTFHNFGGIKTTDGSATAHFADDDAGVVGQCAHLAWYVYSTHIQPDCDQIHDPRHSNTHKNTIHKLSDFGNGNWNTGDTYAGKMVKFYDEIMSFKEEPVTFDPVHNAADKAWLDQRVRDIQLGEPANTAYALKHYLEKPVPLGTMGPSKAFLSEKEPGERQPDTHMRGTPPAGHPAASGDHVSMVKPSQREKYKTGKE